MRTRRHPGRPLTTLLALLLVGATAPVAHAQRTAIEPEAATGRQIRVQASATRHMIATAHPLATQAGLEVLREGGSAADAAIAAQLVLGLVEPQSSGLGGGGFLLAWDAARRQLTSWDGRETAPQSARPDRFPQGRPFDEIVASGLSVGVPGVPRLIEAVHRAQGRLPWPRLIAPARRLAEDGFPVSPRLSALLANMGPDKFAAAARAYFFDPDGRARPAGYRLRNPDYAATLRRIAEQGADAFYAGPIAETIVAAVRAAPHWPGELTLDDLAAYKVVERPSLCFSYRIRTICSMGPPSSGGLALGQLLGLLVPLDLGRDPSAATDARALHLVAEAQKLAYADRDRYVADPDQVAIPSGMLAPEYLATRRRLIDPAKAMPRPQAGEPPGLGRRAGALGRDATHELAGTSHVSVVDGLGNAVSLTTTIEAGFGSRLWAAGFLLNNQLTDFSLRPVDAQGRPVANAAGPGKRPRSSMAPTIVLDEAGAVTDVLGSPGGSRIILYVAKALIGLIDWQMQPQAVADLANFGSRGEAFEAEAGLDAGTVDALARLGHRVQRDEMTSGLHIVSRRAGRLLGAADPRREGVAAGD